MVKFSDKKKEELDDVRLVFELATRLKCSDNLIGDINLEIVEIETIYKFYKSKGE